MKFTMVHENYNVCDLDASIEFYGRALGLRELRRHNAADGSFTIAFLGDGAGFELELTELREHKQKYDLGEGEFHLAFKVDDYEAAHKLHGDMGCICYENPGMGLYFIEDPDGYWLEILPQNR